MSKINIPDPKTITTLIDEDVSKYDLSYSDEIRSIIADEMDISVDLLKNINYAWFTNYKTISNEFVLDNFYEQYIVAASFRPKDNIILMSVDIPNEILGRTIHETGHSITLHDSFTTIAEGCALYYQRKWYLKNNNINDFNEQYSNVETYQNSLYLLDLIKNSVFAGNENLLLQMITHGNDANFYSYINLYLQNKGCNYTIEELLFLADILHFHRNNLQLSKTFKEKNSYFYRIFDELYQKIFPVLFNTNSTLEEINALNYSLTEYMILIKTCLKHLENINCSKEEYKDLSKIYTVILADEFHKWDEKELYGNNPETLDDFKNRIPFDALISSFEAYAAIQNQNANKNLS